MNAQNARIRLDKIIESISPDVTQGNIKRLYGGDLSHIGDAMCDDVKYLHVLNGVIKEIKTLNFNMRCDDYKVPQTNSQVNIVIKVRSENSMLECLKKFKTPIRNPLKTGTRFFTPNLFPEFPDDVELDKFEMWDWDNSPEDYMALRCGFIHLTKDDASAHYDAIVEINNVKV